MFPIYENEWSLMVNLWTELMCFNQDGSISTLKIRLHHITLSNENDYNIRISKASTAIDWLSIIQRFELSHKMKLEFPQSVVMLVLLYGSTTWNLMLESGALDVMVIVIGNKHGNTSSNP